METKLEKLKTMLGTSPKSRSDIKFSQKTKTKSEKKEKLWSTTAGTICSKTDFKPTLIYTCQNVVK